MGLFDRRDEKKKDEFDSPVETIDLNAPPPDPEPAGAAPAAAKAQVEEEEEPAPAGDYSIEQAIQLMRTLPQDNVELVVQVVKHTLESTNIKIARIIDDASQKQQDIEGRIKVLRDEIAELEKEIASRKTEIEGLEADYEETTTVKDRLVLAEKLEKNEKSSSSKGGSGSSGKGSSGKGEGGGEKRAGEGTQRPKPSTEPPPRPKPSTKPPESSASADSGKRAEPTNKR